jgi:non-ribosomal peptide synthetase component F
MATQMSILNSHPQRLPGPSLLHDLVHQHVDDDIPALDYQDERGRRHTTSYRELHAKSDLLASHLRDLREQNGLPLAKHFIVPVFIGQCPELYITQLAILKAGGAFCPVTLDAPEVCYGSCNNVGAEESTPAVGRCFDCGRRRLRAKSIWRLVNS